MNYEKEAYLSPGAGGGEWGVRRLFANVSVSFSTDKRYFGVWDLKNKETER